MNWAVTYEYCPFCFLFFNHLWSLGPGDDHPHYTVYTHGYTVSSIPIRFHGWILLEVFIETFASNGVWHAKSPSSREFAKGLTAICMFLHIYTGPAKIDHGFLDTEHYCFCLEKAFRLKYGNAVHLTKKVRVEKNWMILVRSNEK